MQPFEARDNFFELARDALSSRRISDALMPRVSSGRSRVSSFTSSRSAKDWSDRMDAALPPPR